MKMRIVKYLGNNMENQVKYQVEQRILELKSGKLKTGETIEVINHAAKTTSYAKVLCGFMGHLCPHNYIGAHVFSYIQGSLYIIDFGNQLGFLYNYYCDNQRYIVGDFIPRQ